MSSSSQRSSCASKAWAARFGKCLKNLVINWDASLFSLVDPLTADNISKYSGSFYKTFKKIINFNKYLIDIFIY